MVKTFKQYLVEIFNRAQVEEIKNQLKFAVKQAEMAKTKQEKEIGIPIHFSRSDTAPKGFVFAFWMRRVGQKKSLGTPVLKEPMNPKEWIKVFVDPKVLDKKYTYYLIMNLQMEGKFEQMALGSTDLMQIRLSDLKRLKFI